MSLEQRQKISLAHKNLVKPWLGQYVRTEKHRELAREKAMGNKHCAGRACSKETREKIRLSQPMLGKNVPYKPRPTRIGKPSWNAGTRKSFKINCLWCKSDVSVDQEQRKYCSLECYRKANKGEGNYRWIKDRAKVKRDDERGGPLHKQWSRKVKERDGWSCVVKNSECSKKLVAHHIDSWRDFVEKRYLIENGITLCDVHHPRTRKEEIEMKNYLKNLLSHT